MTVHGAELPPAVPPQTVSDNMSAAGFSEAGDTAGSVSDNSVPEGSVTDSEVIPGGAQTDVGDGGQQNPGGENAVSEEAAAAAEPVPVQTVDSRLTMRSGHFLRIPLRILMGAVCRWCFSCRT